MADLFVVASKEFSDIIKGKRFIILLAAFALLMTAAVASTYVSETQGIFASLGLSRGFLRSVASGLTTMMAYFAPILGVSLGVDAVSGEREKGTLKMVLAQPIFRDTFINGKFFGTFLAISLAVSTVSFIVVSGCILMLGITPTGNDVARLILFVLFSILYTMAYYGIAVLISTIAKKTTISVIASVMLWATFTFIISIVASLVASSVTPIRIQPSQNVTSIRPRPGNVTIEQQQLMQALAQRTAISETINMFTPNYHFTRIAQYILQAYASVGFGGFIPGAAGLVPSGETQRTISIVENLSSAWPNILVLVFITVFVFIATYLLFVRQEAR
ncbi:MAG: ABC transporter permease subunit [Candidatus Bathyarchaeia archaeon]